MLAEGPSNLNSILLVSGKGSSLHFHMILILIFLLADGTR